MKFFLDNNLPPKIARAFNTLASPSHTFIHLKEHGEFSAAAPDVEWIEHLAKEKGWIILTKDGNILKKPVEKAAFKKARLTGFFLDKSWNDLNFWLLTSKLADRMPQILELAEKSTPGTCFRVHVRSRDIQQL